MYLRSHYDRCCTIQLVIIRCTGRAGDLCLLTGMSVPARGRDQLFINVIKSDKDVHVSVQLGNRIGLSTFLIRVIRHSSTSVF